MEEDSSRNPDVLSSIMDAAIKNFAEKGYEGARVDEIAHDANVNKATIYYHIGGKEALYKAVLSRVLTSGADLIVANVGKASTPEKKIAAYVDTVLNGVLAGREDFTRIMMREMAGGGANIPSDVLDNMMRKILGTAIGVISTGVKERKLTPVSPVLVHMMIVGGIAFMRATEGLRGKHAGGVMEHDPEIIKEMKTSLSEQITKILLRGLILREEEDTSPAGESSGGAKQQMPGNGDNEGSKDVEYKKKD